VNVPDTLLIPALTSMAIWPFHSAGDVLSSANVCVEMTMPVAASIML
jgi:hypothetical protein